MKRMMAITIRRRRDHRGGAADHAGERVAHHAATGGHQHQEEGPEHLGEEATPLLAGVLEVGDAIEDALLVVRQRSEHALDRCRLEWRVRLAGPVIASFLSAPPLCSVSPRDGVRRFRESLRQRASPVLGPKVPQQHAKSRFTKGRRPLVPPPGFADNRGAGQPRPEERATMPADFNDRTDFENADRGFIASIEPMTIS